MRITYIVAISLTLVLAGACRTTRPTTSGEQLAANTEEKQTRKLASSATSLTFAAQDVNDTCGEKVYDYAVDPSQPNGEHHTRFRCRDGSISYTQPDSKPRFNNDVYEGKCGQTGANNVIAMYCKGAHVSSANVCRDDPTPGTLPITLTFSLDDHFKNPANKNLCPQTGSWHDRWYFRKGDYLDAIKTHIKDCGNRGFARKIESPNGNTTTSQYRCPLLAVFFDHNSTTEAHWVTVIDVVQHSTDEWDCDVIFNTYGEQYKKSCKDFVELARVPIKSIAMFNGTRHLVTFD